MVKCKSQHKHHMEMSPKDMMKPSFLCTIKRSLNHAHRNAPPCARNPALPPLDPLDLLDPVGDAAMSCCRWLRAANNAVPPATTTDISQPHSYKKRLRETGPSIARKPLITSESLSLRTKRLLDWLCPALTVGETSGVLDDESNERIAREMRERERDER